MKKIIAVIGLVSICSTGVFASMNQISKEKAAKYFQLQCQAAGSEDIMFLSVKVNAKTVSGVTTKDMPFILTSDGKVIQLGSGHFSIQNEDGRVFAEVKNVVPRYAAGARHPIAIVDTEDGGKSKLPCQYIR